jgi:hypothetical protein
MTVESARSPEFRLFDPVGPPLVRAAFQMTLERAGGGGDPPFERRMDRHVFHPTPEQLDHR